MRQALTFLLAAALSVALAAPSRAEMIVRLQGTWVGWATGPVVAGLTVPVVEELTIEGDRYRLEGWGYSTLPPACHEALSPAAPPPDCFPRVDLGAGRLDTGIGTLRLIGDSPPVNPHHTPIDMALWPAIALDGNLWNVRFDGERLLLWLRNPPPGEDLGTRVFFRAPPQAAGALLLHLDTVQLSIGRSYCGLEALARDPAALAEFFAASIAYRPVLEEAARIAAERPMDRDRAMRRMALLMPGRAEFAHINISDIDPAARAAAADLRQWLEAGRPAPEGQGVLRTLAFPVSPRLAEAETSCLTALGLDY